MASYKEFTALSRQVELLFARVTALEAENTELRVRCAKLEKENAGLVAENEILHSKVNELETENARLREQVNKNSKNSHKPPSSDGYRKAVALPKPTSGIRGGQPGHEGSTLTMVANPDFVVVHHAVGCSCCGRKFGVEDVIGTHQKRQVFDIPVPKMEVTEHRQGVVRCCERDHIAAFPSYVAGVTQYGPRLRTVVTLLNVDCRVPYKKVSTLIYDVFGAKIHAQTIVNITESAYLRLEDAISLVFSHLLQSLVVHYDETGMRVAGKLHWFHTACNALYSYTFVHENRGKQALNSAESVLPTFENWAIHDCWASYFAFDGCKHGLCGAHLLRELDALREKQSKWAAKMRQLLLQLYEASQKGTTVAPQVLNGRKWSETYDEILAEADTEEPLGVKSANGRNKNSVGRCLRNRLVEYKAEATAFALVKEVPFTNNCAEQNIRNVKVKQKVSMSFRSFHGAQIYARIQSFIATIRKQAQNPFTELGNIFQGNPYALNANMQIHSIKE